MTRTAKVQQAEEQDHETEPQRPLEQNAVPALAAVVHSENQHVEQ